MAGLPFQQHLLENGGGEGGEGQEGGALEDSELARLLPRLTRPGYYTEPPLQQVCVWCVLCFVCCALCACVW